MSQKNIYILTGVLLVVCLLIGYTAGRGYKTYEIGLEKKMEMEYSKMSHKTDEHQHDKESVNPKYIAPKITNLKALQDTMSGYNVNFGTQYFRFTPDMAGKEVVQNSGHAHVYVNDVKVGRAYSNWYHIPESFFKPGTNTIAVTLNANNHGVWWSKNGTVEAIATTTVVYKQ